MRGTSVGVFRTRDQVAAAVEELRENGFSSARISVLFPDNIGTRSGGPVEASGVIGARADALLGGTLEWLSDVAVVAIPRSGRFIVAGPIGAAIDRLAEGNSLSSALLAIGIEPGSVALYEARVEDGSILLAVEVPDSDWGQLAAAIMARAEATAINSSGSVKGRSMPNDRSIRPSR
ncbi:MAG: hypothetical protein MNPFHGCM_02555 [Gemmatimonadaceae bacterium]|nr:hypothetical protein [Gemmatimonadaceae bacterium]